MTVSLVKLVSDRTRTLCTTFCYAKALSARLQNITECAETEGRVQIKKSRMQIGPRIVLVGATQAKRSLIPGNVWIDEP